MYSKTCRMNWIGGTLKRVVDSKSRTSAPPRNVVNAKNRINALLSIVVNSKS